MEKEVGSEKHSPARQESYDWSVQESPEDPDVDVDVDFEKDGAGEDLSRVVSGPPYTIFSPRTKMFIVLSVSVSSLISPFGATTFYPAINVLARELHVTPTLMNLALTTYMVRILLPYRLTEEQKS